MARPLVASLIVMAMFGLALIVHSAVQDLAWYAVCSAYLIVFGAWKTRFKRVAVVAGAILLVIAFLAIILVNHNAADGAIALVALVAYCYWFLRDWFEADDSRDTSELTED